VFSRVLLILVGWQEEHSASKVFVPFIWTVGGHSIIESRFEYIANLNLDSVKKCIILTNLNTDSDSVNSA